jgi:Mg-chelatase subunit ChlD
MAFEPTKQPENVDLIRMLADRGFDRETVPALLLLPLVHVAWADGVVEQSEADTIRKLAVESGLLTPAAGELVQEWLEQRPDPEEMDAQLELISLLLASVDDELPVSVRDVEDLAKAVGKAAGGVFGLFFRLNDDEKAALATIREKLRVHYDGSWNKTLGALRDDWQITDWNEFDAPLELSGLNADDPLLFTDSRAVDLYEKGDWRSMKGDTLSKDDLVKDIRIDVMRATPWKKDDLQFRHLQDQWQAQGLIEDAGVFWNNSPHSTVFNAKANIKFRIEDKTHRIKKGQQVAYMCQMAQEMMDLDGPFAAGNFAPTSDGMLCGEMSNAMKGMGDMDMGGDMGMDMGGGGMKMGGGGMKMNRPPALDIRKLRVLDNDRVAYLVLDLSGSMNGKKLKMAKMAVMSFIEAIPVNAGVRLVIRPFSGHPFPTLLPLETPFTMKARMHQMQRVKGMHTHGATALFKTVNMALDDTLRMANRARMTVPKTFLVVLSDGEDTDGIGTRYRRFHGVEALFARMKDYRELGLIEYMPIAYGGSSAVRHLQQLGGRGFKLEVTSPQQIVARFGEIRQKLMVGMPMGGVNMGGMKMGGMSGMNM